MKTFVEGCLGKKKKKADRIDQELYTCTEWDVMQVSGNTPEKHEDLGSEETVPLGDEFDKPYAKDYFRRFA